MSDPNSPEKIVIGWDDLDDAPDTMPTIQAPYPSAGPSSYPQQPGARGLPPSGGALPGLGPQPQALPVNVYGQGAYGAGAFLAKLGANSIISGLCAGFIGGLIGFFFSEILDNPDKMTATTSGGADVQVAIWALLFGLVLGAVLMAWDGITSSSPEKALIDGLIGAGIGAGSGFIGGLICQWIYGNMLQHLTGDLDSIKGQLILARMAGWAVFGLILGLGLGARGGGRKLVNGLIGGVVGGAVAGIIFQLIDNASTSSGAFGERFLGLTFTGVGIGLAVGLVERARRDSWVRISSGPMTGKEFILYKPSTTVGRDYRCDIVVAKDLAVAPMHATFVRDGAGNVSVMPGPGAQIAVNGVASAGGRLRNSDAVTIGSSTLVYQERASATAGQGPMFMPPGGGSTYGYPQAPGYPQTPGGYPPGYR